MLRDTLLVFGRAMRQLLRNPVWLIFGLTQPVLYRSRARTPSRRC